MSTFDLIAPRLPALAACVLCGILCLRLGRALPTGRQRRSLSGFGAQEESGTAMLDFVLTFPLFTMIVLIVIQFALMVNARIVVSYAAYAAARSAVVWTEGGAEGAEARARAAAAVACMPISPSPLGSLQIPDPGLFPLFVFTNEAPLLEGNERIRRWLRSGGKHVYSRLATEVEIAGAGEEGEFGPRDPVTVTVTHRFHLAVPYADGVFSSFWGGSLLGWETVPIRDSYTLINEGKVRTTGEGMPRCRSGIAGLWDMLRALLG